MTATPHKQRKNWWLVTVAIGLPLLLLLGIGGHRMFCVAALQNAMANPADVSLGADGASGPEWARIAVDYVVKHSGGTVEGKGVLSERLSAVFRSKTHIVALRDPHGIGADISGALQRFPDVRKLFIREHWYATSEGEVKTLLGHLRQMKNLEFVYLEVPALSDAAFASLAGHPKLRTVHIEEGSFGLQILETLKTLPSLKELNIDLHRNPALLRQDTEQIFRDSLPGVRITVGSP
jgi:hypothetical protein